MTYNIRHGWGIKKLFGLKDIFHTIKKHHPDIIGLNEVDIYNPRSLFVHQAKVLARKMKFNYAFEPNLKIGPIGYGNSILTKFPIVEVNNYPLSSKGEQRGCLSVMLDILNGIQGGKIRVLCTHLGLDKIERKQQIRELVDIVKKTIEPTILMGDLNCDKEELIPLKEVLFDALSHSKERDDKPNTYPTVKLGKRLDYLFHNFGFQVLNYKTIYSEASDHLPVLATVKLVKESKNV